MVDEAYRKLVQQLKVQATQDAAWTKTKRDMAKAEREAHEAELKARAEKAADRRFMREYIKRKYTPKG